MSDSCEFIHDDFLLETEQAKRLYHDYAADMPIFDYHCHISPQQIADNHSWTNMADIWLGGDHYKWRAMRTNGVEERFCTGKDTTPWQKFEKWAETLPRTLRNPLFHWSHLELKRYFGVSKLLTPATAKEIWEECNAQLVTPDFACRRLIERSNVSVVCTTDDPVDNLEYHAAITESGFSVKVLPAWRPDKGMAVEDVEGFNAWMDTLAEVSGIEIGDDFDNYINALKKRHDFFHEAGCRLSDHGIETAYAADYTMGEIKALFRKIRGGHAFDAEETLAFKSCMLYEFGVMDHSRGWTQQYHLGAIRNNNSRLFAQLGPDTGFDSIGDFEVARPLAKLLDRLDSSDQLAPTILYNLNPRDNELMATMIGNFQDGSKPGKIQYGSGWWFLDQRNGMTQQIEALSQLGLLSRFVGMLTDSRSFLSYTRHEYFRRVLCNILGKDMVAGAVPDDMEWVGEMVKDISFRNAEEYFGFDLTA